MVQRSMWRIANDLIAIQRKEDTASLVLELMQHYDERLEKLERELKDAKEGSA